MMTNSFSNATCRLPEGLLGFNWQHLLAVVGVDGGSVLQSYHCPTQVEGFTDSPVDGCANLALAHPGHNTRSGRQQSSLASEIGGAISRISGAPGSNSGKPSSQGDKEPRRDHSDNTPVNVRPVHRPVNLPPRPKPSNVYGALNSALRSWNFALPGQIH